MEINRINYPQPDREKTWLEKAIDDLNNSKSIIYNIREYTKFDVKLISDVKIRNNLTESDINYLIEQTRDWNWKIDAEKLDDFRKSLGITEKVMNIYKTIRNLDRLSISGLETLRYDLTRSKYLNFKNEDLPYFVSFSIEDSSYDEIAYDQAGFFISSENLLKFIQIIHNGIRKNEFFELGQSESFSGLDYLTIIDSNTLEKFTFEIKEIELVKI